MMEEALDGGNVNQVSRHGDRVLRSAGAWTPTIHRLLAYLRGQGLDWVPEPFGTTEDGREIVSYLPGDVPAYPMPDWVWDDALLVDTARKLRQMHDATASYTDPEAHWRMTPHAPAEVICHNDFAPYNMVFRDRGCTGVFDFDMASPGPRLWDLAYLAYRIVPLTAATNPDGIDFPVERRMERLDTLIGAYGSPYARTEVLRMTITRLEDLARFSERTAKEANRSELLDHAALYRADARYLLEIGDVSTDTIL
jgi:Ser/Thr protein kinase RdoA (MazF antagonist)